MKTSLFLLLSLGAVLVQKFEELSSGVLVESVRELGNCRWHLQALVEDDLLALQADILRPFNEAS